MFAINSSVPAKTVTEFIARANGQVEVLNKAVNAGLVDPKLNARLADLGNVPLPGPPATFGKLIADEAEKWGKVIRFAGIKPQ